MSLRGQIQDLARQFEEEDNRASDLWTWLPSYQEAKRHHGDYADEHQPRLSDLLAEATIVISALKGSQLGKEDHDWFKCPCGEDHDPSPVRCNTGLCGRPRKDGEKHCEECLKKYDCKTCDVPGPGFNHSCTSGGCLCACHSYR